MVYTYNFQEMPNTVDIFVDTDFACCKDTWRSTSGGAIMVGKCLVKHWAKTQTTISLSSGESELHGIASGCAQALGVQSLMHDMGWKMPITVHSDATAAIGIARRKGLGKILTWTRRTCGFKTKSGANKSSCSKFSALRISRMSSQNMWTARLSKKR